MSKKIRFRGWSVDEKKMYSPVWPTWNGSVECWLENKPQSSIDHFSANGPDDHMIVMQFTGLTDKNGVEIYEGDIVKQEYSFLIRNDQYGDPEFAEGEHIGQVVIIASKGVCMRNYKHIDYDDYDSNGRFVEGYKNVCGERCEIIGNIYENPELLECV